ncbi:MAG TPA: hypothetical protein DDW68_12085 [Verrucomicrobiales bacterium]|nr:hypothetical protein [Verrucomicrobiales bacterium]HBE97900.1 hypothetical protein [Verrucomicrobiales bacterium]|tara:strand:+ start:123 stop:593 length:471 start_codon:yes stop_codon:yes gene_type:complete
MIVLPTLNGGIKLVIEREQDWDNLKSISDDAAEDFSKRFSLLMDEDSMWDEIVEPELKDQFSSQVEFVEKQVELAFDNSVDDFEEELPEILITEEESKIWYGALNQARLSFEEKFRKEIEDLKETGEIENREVVRALFRNQFYFRFQSQIMDHTMD